MSDNFLDRIAPQPYAPVSRPLTRPSAANGPSFADVLKQVESSTPPLKISAHAVTRMAQRGVDMSAEDWTRVGHAVARAEQKGARDAYVMYGNTGFVVNVPNRTVVTAMVHSEEHIVTNVDSVVTVPRLDR